MKQMYNPVTNKIETVPDDWTFANFTKKAHTTKSAGQTEEADKQAERMVQAERTPKRRGRPMIGERRLTATEMQRRWRAKKKLLGG